MNAFFTHAWCGSPSCLPHPRQWFDGRQRVSALPRLHNNSLSACYGGKIHARLALLDCILIVHFLGCPGNPVTDATLELWRGFVSLILSAYFEKRMAWYPVDRLQLEVSAVTGATVCCFFLRTCARC